MPGDKNKKKQKKQKPQVQKLGKETLSGINKMANAYSVYEKRLGLRASMNVDQKNALLRQFMENYKDDIQLYIRGNNLDSLGTETLKAMGLKETAIAFVASYGSYIVNEGANFVGEDNFARSSGAYTEDVKNMIEGAAQSGATINEEGGDITVSEEQNKGLREIAKWLYRNSENRTAARRGSAHLGKSDHSIFIEELLKKSPKQRLLIYYLIEKGNPKQCTAEDIVRSQSYIPDLTAFKDKMHKSWIKRLFKKENIQWDNLGLAVQSAGVAINSIASLESKEETEDQKKKIEARFDAIRNDSQEEQEFLTSFNFDSDEDPIRDDPSLEEQLKMLPMISNRLRQILESQEKTAKTKDPSTAKDNVDGKDAAEYGRLLEALAKTQGNLAEKIKDMEPENVNSHATKDVKDPAAMNTMLFKKMGDGLSKLPITGFMSAGTAISACAILIKVGGLIKNHSILSSADISERVLSLLAACADFSANASKLGLITTAMNTGNMLNVAGAMSTANTVGGAMGVVSGGMSMAVAAVEAGRADSLRKGINKAGAHLDEISPYDTDLNDADVSMAGNIKEFLHSMYYEKALSAGKNMISGALTAAGGALTLSGVGTIPGLVVMGAGMVVNIGGMIIGKVKAGKYKRKALDAFFRLDEIMDDLGQKLPDPIKNNKKIMGAIRKELKLYAEAKMGAASDDQALNIIMSRYSHFLWTKTFMDADGNFRPEDFYSNNPADDEDRLAFACKAMVSALGVKLRFGADGTKEDEIRRRMKL